jgi:hypothetical protein
MKYTHEQVIARLYELGHPVPAGLHLVGIRSQADKPNEFDDGFFLFKGHRFQMMATGTTNPGRHWLQNLLNPNGAFLLKPGQYADTWQLGKHKGNYDAWVQVKPVTGWRDANKDDKADAHGTLYTGLFGINIHRASETAISKYIDKWSAGCQVINNPFLYGHFIEQSKQAVREGQLLFTYTLLGEWS